MGVDLNLGLNPDSDVPTLYDLELSPWFPNFSTVTQIIPHDHTRYESLGKISDMVAKGDLEHFQQHSAFRDFWW